MLAPWGGGSWVGVVGARQSARAGDLARPPATHALHAPQPLRAQARRLLLAGCRSPGVCSVPTPPTATLPGATSFSTTLTASPPITRMRGSPVAGPTRAGRMSSRLASTATLDALAPLTLSLLAARGTRAGMALRGLCACSRLFGRAPPAPHALTPPALARAVVRLVHAPHARARRRDEVCSVCTLAPRVGRVPALAAPSLPLHFQAPLCAPPQGTALCLAAFATCVSSSLPPEARLRRRPALTARHVHGAPTGPDILFTSGAAGATPRFSAANTAAPTSCEAAC